MAKTMILSLLRTLMILLFAMWILLWFLKPTDTWTRKWREVEDSMQTTIFKYNGAGFVVYTFPIVALAMLGFLHLYLQPRRSTRRRVTRHATALTNPLMVKTPVGVLSGIEVLSMSLLLTLLVWTFYARISNDYKKLIPIKQLKLNIWQLKFLKMATRFGLLAEICLAFLLLPILRGMSILRLLNIQFEASVRYHIWLGTSMVFFAALHGSGTLFIWGINHKIQDEVWRWQKEGRIYMAGAITLLTGLVIWITSLPFVRRKKFEVFYYMHHLYVVFIIFFLFHAGDRHFYMVLPGVFLFGLDKLLRVIQSRPETHILSARIFPSKTIELTLPKHPRLKYTPTSIIFINIPSISKFHWHPFSITTSSSVDDQTMSVTIRCEGWWTKCLHDILLRKDPPGETKSFSVALEGPYGPASFDFMRYDNLLLIAGGIGITPILSILKEIASTKANMRGKFPLQIHLIYITKNSQDISLLKSISHLLLNQASELWHLKLRVFVTQENKGGSSIKELLNEVLREQTITFDMERSKHTFGPGNYLWLAIITGFSSIVFLLSLCFFNHFLFPPKMKPSKEKRPSSVVDLFLLCSFLIAIGCSAMVAMVVRWRSSSKVSVSTRGKGDDKAMELGSIEAMTTLEEQHEIHYGGRPIFQELLSELEREFEGSNVGVVVCGPESMKDSIALACKQRCQLLKFNAKKKQQPLYVFQSLNFTL